MCMVVNSSAWQPYNHYIKRRISKCKQKQSEIGKIMLPWIKRSTANKPISQTANQSISQLAKELNNQPASQHQQTNSQHGSFRSYISPSTDSPSHPDTNCARSKDKENRKSCWEGGERENYMSHAASGLKEERANFAPIKIEGEEGNLVNVKMEGDGASPSYDLVVNDWLIVGDADSKIMPMGGVSPPPGNVPIFLSGDLRCEAPLHFRVESSGGIPENSSAASGGGNSQSTPVGYTALVRGDERAPDLISFEQNESKGKVFEEEMCSDIMGVDQAQIATGKSLKRCFLFFIF